MRAVILALLFVLLPLSADAQTVLFFSGAETGDTSEWVGGVTASGWVADNAATSVKTGGYGFHVATTNKAMRSSTGFGLTTGYARFWFRWETNAGDDWLVHFLNAANTISLGLCMQGSTHKLAFCNNGITMTAIGATALTVSTWYLIEFQAVVSATVGGVVVKVNGTTDLTSLTTNTSAIVALDSLQFYTAVGPNVDWKVDDVMICSGGFCPSGRTIARQGAAGTSTYTAWTLTSCTGSVINGCWSDTPFSATSNANSATLNNAQTMLVSTFSATQTGHGTETIDGGATINACKTAMIAKGASGTPSIKIRRRLSGVDTDTTKTMTTADAYYEDGIWTTTAAVLRGSTMEIGVSQNQTTVTETVEDMWMICDYNAGTAVTRHSVSQD